MNPQELPSQPKNINEPAVLGCGVQYDCIKLHLLKVEYVLPTCRRTPFCVVPFLLEYPVFLSILKTIPVILHCNILPIQSRSLYKHAIDINCTIHTTYSVYSHDYSTAVKAWNTELTLNINYRKGHYVVRTWVSIIWWHIWYRLPSLTPNI